MYDFSVMILRANHYLLHQHATDNAVLKKVMKNFVFQNIQKMLGFAPSRAANKQGSGFFNTPSQAGK